MSISVYNRPMVPSAAQLAYTNKQFDYNYMSLSGLSRPGGSAFNPKLGQENRRTLAAA
jgi:hypothetical protein